MEALAYGLCFHSNSCSLKLFFSACLGSIFYIASVDIFVGTSVFHSLDYNTLNTHKGSFVVVFSADGPGKPSSSQYIECVMHLSRIEISFK